MIKVAWSDLYAHPLPANHRFPMEKYELLPRQLIHEGTLSEENFFRPTAVTSAQILAVHNRDYWDRLCGLQLSRQEIRKTGFPLSAELVDREVHIMGGTLEAARFALEHGVAFNIAGGTHHAFTDRGEGFCLLNDIAIAARHLLENGFQRILVVDLDVHQGNGTAQIFRDETRVFTFSMHGAHNYPMTKEHSDLDIPLPDKIEDKEYLELLEEHLFTVMEKFRPEFVFFQSGVDVLATDKLGRLGLSIQGCKERDRTVIQACFSKGIPWVASMGGGYSERIADIVEAHANTYRLAHTYYH